MKKINGFFNFLLGFGLVISSTFSEAASKTKDSSQEESGLYGFEKLEDEILAMFKQGKGVEALNKYFFKGPIGKYLSEDKKNQVVSQISGMMGMLGPIVEIKERHQVKCVADVWCASASVLLTERQPQFIILRYYKHPRLHTWVLHAFNINKDLDAEWTFDPILKD